MPAMTIRARVREITRTLAYPVVRIRGITVVELMIGLAVAAILSSIALPGFEAYLHKSRRSDALVAAMAVQTAQERFRGHAATYGSLAEIGVAGTSPAKHYTLHVSANDTEGFELLATATGAQSRDAACRYMKLASVGMNLVYSSGPDPAVANVAAANRKCWSL